MKRPLLSIMIALGVFMCANSLALANLSSNPPPTKTCTSTSCNLQVHGGGGGQSTGEHGGSNGGYAKSGTYSWGSPPPNPPTKGQACNQGGIYSSVNLNSLTANYTGGSFQVPYSVTFTVADTGGQVYGVSVPTQTNGLRGGWSIPAATAGNETITVPLGAASGGGYNQKIWDTEVPYVIYAIANATYEGKGAANPWECVGGQITFSIGYTKKSPPPIPSLPVPVILTASSITADFPAGSIIPKNKIFIDQFAQCFTVVGQDTTPSFKQMGTILYQNDGLNNGIRYPYRFTLGLSSPGGYTWNFGDGTGNYPGVDPQTNQANSLMPCQNQGMYPGYMTEHPYRTIDGLGGIQTGGVTVKAWRQVQVFVAVSWTDGPNNYYACASPSPLNGSITGWSKPQSGTITSSNFNSACAPTSSLPNEEATAIPQTPVKEINVIGIGSPAP